jgi:hypothetical protein
MKVIMIYIVHKDAIFTLNLGIARMLLKCISPILFFDNTEFLIVASATENIWE